MKKKKSKGKLIPKIPYWSIVSGGFLVMGIFLLVMYFNTNHDVRSKADETKIEFIDHAVAKVEGKDMAITVEKPSTAQEGDMLIAIIGSDYAHVDSLPSGWKTIRQDVKNKGHKDDLALQTYYKIVSASEENTYTWNMASQRKDTPSDDQPLIAVDVYVFRGVDPNNPIFSSSSHAESENPAAVKCPSVKGISGGMLLCSYMGDDPGTIQAPESMTQTSDFEIGGGDAFAVAYEMLTSDGKTGNRTAAWNNPERITKGSSKNGSDFAQAIVLRPTQ